MEQNKQRLMESLQLTQKELERVREELKKMSVVTAGLQEAVKLENCGKVGRERSPGEVTETPPV